MKSQCLQKESPEDPVLHPAPPQISIIRQLGGDGGPRCPTLDPTHPVSPDQGAGPGLIQDQEASLGLEVGL